jgi:hypothetical protein
MARITNKDLTNRVERINELLDTDIYELDNAYGGVKLARNDSYADVLSCGYTSKKELHSLMCAFIDGIGAGINAVKGV